MDIGAFVVPALPAVLAHASEQIRGLGPRHFIAADKMSLPNTILAGAQKSGTTALCRFLDGHPQCFVSVPKEPNFFSRASNLSKLESYEICFRTAKPGARILVDGTTTYMADPRIPNRIRGCLGDDVKFIFMLRSPSARAYSGFLHMLKRGHDRRTADEVFLCLPDDPQGAVACEKESILRAASRGRLAAWPYTKMYDDVFWNYRYIGNSFYSSLIQNYSSIFPCENILVLFMEEVIVDLKRTQEMLGAFLGVDSALFPDVLPRRNVTHLPQVATPFGWLLEQARRIKNRDFTLVRPSEINSSPLSPSHGVSEKLERIFQTEIVFWSEYVGRDLHAVGW